MKRQIVAKLRLGYFFVLGILVIIIWYFLVGHVYEIEYTIMDYGITTYGFISCFSLFIWMLVHFIRNYVDVKHRPWWVVIFITTSYIGAVAYFFIIYKNQNRTNGGQLKGLEPFK